MSHPFQRACFTCKTSFNPSIVKKPEIRTFIPESHKKPVWLYKTSNQYNNEYWLYDDRTNEIIEKAWLAKECNVEVKILGYSYKINLNSMEQHRLPVGSSKNRKIKRLQANDPVYTTKTGLFGNYPVMSIIGKAGVLKRQTIQWRFKGPRWSDSNFWEKFDVETTRKLENEFKRVIVNGKGTSVHEDLVEISTVPFYDGHGSKKAVKFLVDFVDGKIYRKSGFQEKITIKRIDPNVDLDLKKSGLKRVGGLIFSGLPVKISSN